jgi:hypothetical protein
MAASKSGKLIKPTMTIRDCRTRKSKPALKFDHPRQIETGDQKYPPTNFADGQRVSEGTRVGIQCESIEVCKAER